MQQIDLSDNSVNIVLNQAIARRNHTAVSYENKLYIHGGITNNGGFSATNTMDIYDTVTNQWTTGSPSPSNRFGHDSVVYNGKIYLFGGQDEFAGLDAFINVEVYDIQSNSWSTLNGTKVFQTMGTATLIDGLIYLIGGENDSISGEVVDVFIFDPESSQFLESDPIAAPAVSSRKDHMAAAYNGRIYVFGPPSDSFQRYTPKSSDKTLVSFNRISAEILEGNWDLSVSVSLTNTSDQNASVDYILSSENTASNADFSLTSGTLNFSAGELSKSISYSIIDDLIPENLESFTIILTNPNNLSLGDQSSFKFTILDDD